MRLSLSSSSLDLTVHTVWLCYSCRINWTTFILSCDYTGKKCQKACAPEIKVNGRPVVRHLPYLYLDSSRYIKSHNLYLLPFILCHSNFKMLPLWAWMTRGNKTEMHRRQALIQLFIYFLFVLVYIWKLWEYIFYKQVHFGYFTGTVKKDKTLLRAVLFFRLMGHFFYY